VTSTSKQRLTDYLLGNLTEAEQSALESEFFNHPVVFDELVSTETALVDDYARGRLSGPALARFEQHYLAQPRLRDRARFAQLLTKTIDDLDGAASVREHERSRSMWSDLVSTFGRFSVAKLSMAAAMLALIAASGWLLVQNGRLRREMGQTQAARQVGEQREHDLERQLSAERTEAQQLSSELQRLQTPTRPSTPSVISLLLNVRSTRGADAEPTPAIIIAPGISQVRVRVALDQGGYPAYGVALSSIAGQPILTRQHLRARSTSAGPVLELTIPAEVLAAGDYVLTLSGEASSLEHDDVGKSLFRVERR
jgi:hypothetical protein